MSKGKEVSLKEAGDALKDYLYQFGIASYIAMDDGMEKTAQDTKNYLKRKTVSPTGQGKPYETKSGKTSTKHYRTSFRVYKPRKKAIKNGADPMWRVIGSKAYQLDHLLEDGHVVKWHKNDSNHPIDPRNRVHSSVTSAHYRDEYHTTQYDQYENAYNDVASEVFVSNILKALNELLK